MSLTQASLIFVAIVSISLTDIPDRGELCVNDNIYFFFFSLGGGGVCSGQFDFFGSGFG